MDSFEKDFSKELGITRGELYRSFVRIKQTGFLDEDFETEDGDVDADNNTFNSLSVDSTGFYITKMFLRFYDIVLKMEV